MDARTYRVAVSIVSFVFASVGFLLSVFAITLDLFLLKSQFPANERIPPKRKGRPSHTSDEPSDPSVTSSSAPLTPKSTEHSNPRVTISLYTDEDLPPSDPQHQSVENMRSDYLHSKANNKSTTIRFPPDDLHSPPRPTSSSSTSRTPRISTSERILVASDDNRPGFRLANLKPLWGEKQPKIYRCASSPHLTTPSVPWSPPVHDEQKSTPNLVKKKSRKNIAKESSVPKRTGLIDGSRSSSCPRVNKKRSETLRTQPYEAPYFFPPPIPTSDIPRRPKPLRSNTQPPPLQSSALLSPSLIPNTSTNTSNKVIDSDTYR